MNTPATRTRTTTSAAVRRWGEPARGAHREVGRRAGRAARAGRGVRAGRTGRAGRPGALRCADRAGRAGRAAVVVLLVVLLAEPVAVLRVAPADGPADGLGVRGTGTGAGAFRGAGVRAGVGRAEPERDTGELGAAVRAGELRGAAGPPGWRAPGVPDGLTPHSLASQEAPPAAFALFGAPPGWA
ncbi:MAG: hypothetical protein PGN11_11230 [Quadrisphaera sp.]